MPPISRSSQHLGAANSIQTPAGPVGTRTLIIPPIVHQTWKRGNNQSIPENWRSCASSWAHPWLANGASSLRILWGDNSLRDAVEIFSPGLLATYDSYPTMVQRTDAARLVLLYLYGGIYADLDVCVE